MKIKLQKIDKDIIDLQLHDGEKIVKGNTWQNEVFSRIDEKDIDLIIKFIEVGVNSCLESLEDGCVEGRFNFIQRLLDAIEITDLIGRYVNFVRKSGVNYFACCPFHDEKTPSFSVSQTKQFYYCFGCGANGNAIDFMMKYKKLDFPEAVKKLANYADIAITQESDK